jgi:hypothetical protein
MAATEGRLSHLEHAILAHEREDAELMKTTGMIGNGLIVSSTDAFVVFDAS